MVWRRDDPQGHESAKIKHLIVPYTRGYGVDVGCGLSKAYPHFLGVDNGKQYDGKSVTDLDMDGARLSIFGDNRLDFVFSSHFLEHCENYVDVLQEWWRVIKPGGHLVLYLPHRSFYPNIGEDGANEDHKHDFVPRDIFTAMRRVTGDKGCACIEDEDRNDDNEYSFFQVYQKTHEPALVYKPWRKPEKACLVVRYGGFGDHLQTSSVLVGLKEQGWHITYNTDPRGQDILAHDPHVDAWLVQDKDQVPNPWLGEYWSRLAKRYDKVINLSGSVETTVLPAPENIMYKWPTAARQKALGHINYLERMHDIAEVPYQPGLKFYPSEAERSKAQKRYQETKRPVILWVLSGSAVHKAWPYTFTVAAKLLHAGANIVTCGTRNKFDDATALEESIAEFYLRVYADIDEAVLEQKIKDLGQPAYLGWLQGQVNAHLKRKAFRPTSGVWSIRETLAFAQVADCVVGPETGVLNAVAFEPNPKVIMLSHSSHDNLTRDWVNTKVMQPQGVPCQPCHRLHYGWDHCVRDEKTGGAACAAAIDPVDMLYAVSAAIGFDVERYAA